MKNFLRNSLSVTCKVMKYSMMIITVVCSLSSMLMANAVNAQKLENATVSLSADGKNISEILAEIETKTQLRFVYNPDHLKKDVYEGKVFRNEKVKVLLNRLGYTAREEAGSIIITRLPRPQKPGRISGKIVDDKGEPLPGASIKLIELNKVVSSSVDGTYQFSVEPGTYNIEVSYISFQTKRIADVVVKDGQLLKLDIVLNASQSALKEVVIQSTYNKESIAGLYAQQKNAASMTNGISAAEIARTPDNNMGQVLKRVSGVTTIDNRYVVVRGMSERYNQAMIDGIIVPSTDMNRRNFSFDVVPAELVSNVVVNKTATPDMSSEFSGGQISVNTLDLPESDFFSITIGSGINDQTIGKKIMSAGGRGKYDYLGFDDGRRKQPANTQAWNWQPWMAAGNGDRPPEYAVPQSKQFRAESFKLYNYTAVPNQNYKVSGGKLFTLKNQDRIGFTGGLTYRNTQEINNFQTARREIFGTFTTEPNFIDDPLKGGKGSVNKFNTTLGGVLNAGYQSEHTKITLKNMYSHIFSDNLFESYSYNSDRPEGDQRQMDYFADPEAVTVLQNKLEGEYLIGESGFVLNWSAAMTNIWQGNNDRRKFRYGELTDDFGNQYYQRPYITQFGGADGLDADQRMWTSVRERDYNWAASVSRTFDFLKDKSTIKLGYAGWHKKRNLNAFYAYPFTAKGNQEFTRTYEDIFTNSVGYGPDQAYYYVDSDANGSQFEGAAKYNGLYLMLDQRFMKKLRLVYGVRAENFDLQSRQNAWIKNTTSAAIPGYPPITGEKNWRFLPSANLTYSLNKTMNFRAAYSVTMVRPDFRETSYFQMYDPYLDAVIQGWDVQSTKIQNYDLRYEWYPSAGELIGISGFYKDFDKPLELFSDQTGYYKFQNQRSAKVKGVELEFRKSLGFIADKQWLQNLYLFGNGTLMQSKVRAIKYEPIVDNGVPKLIVTDLPYQDRPLYGQSPYLINGGINYESPAFSANIAYNRSGYRSYTVNADPNQIQYENGRDLVDAQVSVRMFKRKAEIKLNVGNLLNAVSEFYVNTTQYIDKDKDGNFINRNGTDAYEPELGDAVLYRIKYGRTFNLSLNYKF